MLSSPFKNLKISLNLYENLYPKDSDNAVEEILSEGSRTSRKDIIKSAIESNSVISFYYLGDAEITKGYRVVEPYVMGLGAKGQQFLRAFQISKASKSENNPYWRVFNIQKMRNIGIFSKKFWKPRPLYNPNGDVLIPKIDVKVSFSKKKKGQR